jgi:hypothetical protein
MSKKNVKAAVPPKLPPEPEDKPYRFSTSKRMSASAGSSYKTRPPVPTSASNNSLNSGPPPAVPNRTPVDTWKTKWNPFVMNQSASFASSKGTDSDISDEAIHATDLPRGDEYEEMLSLPEALLSKTSLGKRGSWNGDAPIKVIDDDECDDSYIRDDSIDNLYKGPANKSRARRRACLSI